MQFIATFSPASFLDSIVSLVAAFVLGTVIGAERQYRQRSAGLRTNVLVAVGAASFVDLAIVVGGADGAIRVIAYVVSGIGFLGAGVIMKDGGNIRGLNTAATLWASAAVGACAGADRVAEAALITVFVLAGNTLLIPLVHAIDRIPFDEGNTEATYEIRVTADSDRVPTVRQGVLAELKRARYPVADVNLVDGVDDTTEIVATLVSTSANTSELDVAVNHINRLNGVRHAAWEASTVD
jgi:putative Mg2+ transporter-C (MgtC) family protein